MTGMNSSAKFAPSIDTNSLLRLERSGEVFDGSLQKCHDVKAEVAVAQIMRLKIFPRRRCQPLDLALIHPIDWMRG